MEFAVAFALMFVLDFVWVLYTRSIIEHRHISASFSAAWIILCSGGVTLSFVSNQWALFAAAAGAFCGTFASSKWAYVRKDSPPAGEAA